jgi:hypothetical protein
VASFVGVMATTDAPTRALLTRAELADVLRVSLSTVDRLRCRGVLRPVQLVPNGRVGFRVEDVAALLGGPLGVGLAVSGDLDRNGHQRARGYKWADAERGNLLALKSGFWIDPLLREEHRADDGGSTITVCQDKTGTDESSRRAAEWVKENISATANPPVITEGGTVAHFSS